MNIDADTKKTLEYILNNPGTKSFEEARDKIRSEEEAKKKHAKELDDALMEEKSRLWYEAADAIVFGKELHILVTVNKERIKQPRSANDLRCPHCRKPSPRILGNARTMADQIITPDYFGRIKPTVFVETPTCEHCKKTFEVMVQTVL